MIDFNLSLPLQIFAMLLLFRFLHFYFQPKASSVAFIRIFQLRFSIRKFILNCMRSSLNSKRLKTTSGNTYRSSEFVIVLIEDNQLLIYLLTVNSYYYYYHLELLIWPNLSDSKMIGMNFTPL